MDESVRSVTLYRFFLSCYYSILTTEETDIPFPFELREEK